MKKQILLLAILLASFSDGLMGQTLTFSSNDVSAWTDGIVNDGDGGSTDISGLTIEIYNVDESLNDIGKMEWYSDGDLGTSNGFSGITTYFAPSPGDDWKGQIVKESSGLEFQINGFGWYDWGNNNSQAMTVLGFRDNTQVASTTFVGNSDANSVSVSLDASFDNVDEVRIITTTGTTFPVLNNIEISSAIVLSNEKVTDKDLKVYATDNRFVSDNNKVLLEVYSVLGKALKNENLSPGIYIIKATLEGGQLKSFKGIMR